MNAVGVPSSSVVAAPSVAVDQPPLTIDGKPGAFWIGAEFCPYCAETRWALIMAFSKFGMFNNVKETTSSPWDVYPATATFSLHGATYKSRYLSMGKIGEIESNATGPNSAGIKALDPLTPQEQSLQAEYTRYFGLAQEDLPFLDIGNKVFVVKPLYNPMILQGGVLDQGEIAARLTNPKDPITQSIVGEANYLIAGICSITMQQPHSVCTIGAVQKASRALSLT